jgi:hypothetical protein
MSNRVNDILISIVEQQTLKYCRLLADNGFTRDQINEVLARCIPEAEQWRKDTLAEIERWVDEPKAPTHKLQ